MDSRIRLRRRSAAGDLPALSTAPIRTRGHPAASPGARRRASSSSGEDKPPRGELMAARVHAQGQASPAKPVLQGIHIQARCAPNSRRLLLIRHPGRQLSRNTAMMHPDDYNQLVVPKMTISSNQQPQTTPRQSTIIADLDLGGISSMVQGRTSATGQGCQNHTPLLSSSGQRPAFQKERKCHKPEDVAGGPKRTMCS